MAVRGILFDLDGTLADRTATLSVFAREFGGAFADDLREIESDVLFQILRDVDGRGYREKDEVFRLLAAQLPWTQPPAIADLRDFWYAMFPKCTQAMAGTYEVVEGLKAREIQMGIVTNGRVASQNAKIDRLDLRTYMKTVVISEAVAVAKPDARIFQIALEELELPASDVWFVGDHPENDIAGAEAAGMTGVWLSGHLPWPEDRALPNRQMAHLSELLTFIEADYEP